MGELENQESSVTNITSPETTEIQPPNTTPPSTEAPAAPAQAKVGILKKLAQKFASHKKLWLISGTSLLVILLAVTLIKPIKFAAMNVFTSGSAEFVVVDEDTLRPIESVTIKVGGQTGQTDSDGKAFIRNLNFGSHSYSIEKESYTTVSGVAEVNMGSNLVGPIKFHSEGYPVEVRATNKLTGDKLGQFKIKIDKTEISALSDEDGLAILRVPARLSGEFNIVLSSDSYINTTKAVTFKLGDKLEPVTIEATPAGKHYFLSNSSGDIGIYSSNLDGSDRVRVIAGSDDEGSEVALSVAPDNKHGVLVSKREEQKGPSGDLLPALYAVDFDLKTVKRIDEGVPNFTILGWIDNTKIAYSIDRQDYDSKDNYKLKTADLITGKLTTVYKTGNYPSFSFYNEDPSHVYTFMTNPELEDYGLYSFDLTTNKSSRLYPEASYNQLQHSNKPYMLKFEIDNKSFAVDTRTQKVKESESVSKSYLYTPSPNKSQVAWVENRDGKRTLIVGNNDAEKGKAIKAVPVTQIKRWVGEDFVVFNSQTSNENADYIVHIKSGTVTKISDVYLFTYDS